MKKWNIYFVYTPCDQLQRSSRSRDYTKNTKCEQRSTTSASMRLNRMSVAILSLYSLFTDQHAIVHQIALYLTCSFARASPANHESQQRANHQLINCELRNRCMNCVRSFNIRWIYGSFYKETICVCVCIVIGAAVYSPNTVQWRVYCRFLIAIYRMIVFLMSCWTKKHNLNSHQVLHPRYGYFDQFRFEWVMRYNFTWINLHTGFVQRSIYVWRCDE